MGVITKEQVMQIAGETVKLCREEVDEELKKLQWTEERAQQVAEAAAEIAVKRITENFYLSIGKKTVASIGATVVMAVIFLQDSIKSWVGLR